MHEKEAKKINSYTFKKKKKGKMKASLDKVNSKSKKAAILNWSVILINVNRFNYQI